ncbi:MAG TPA: hypothetical protein VK550_12385 [Polyangiaceae bacterium]|nr:hypothetical protein [Polyangiaceae bacterium]
MLFETLVATAITAHMSVSERRANYLANAIVYAVGEDLEGAAAMIVNLHAESGGLLVFERCYWPEKGGWGAFGVAWLWEDRFPGATCGPIRVQAKAAWRILAWHEAPSKAVAFGHYIGAKAVDRHPEARRRAGFHTVVAWELEHKACL